MNAAAVEPQHCSAGGSLPEGRKRHHETLSSFSFSASLLVHFSVKVYVAAGCFFFPSVFVEHIRLTRFSSEMCTFCVFHSKGCVHCFFLSHQIFPCFLLISHFPHYPVKSSVLYGCEGGKNSKLTACIGGTLAKLLRQLQLPRCRSAGGATSPV